MSDGRAILPWSRTVVGALALGFSSLVPGVAAAQAQAGSMDAMSSEANPSGAAPLTPTQRAEREAERALQAAKDGEIARQEAAARLRAERRTRAAGVATAALAEAGAFVKANRDDPDLIDHLQRIADLSAVLSGTEPAPIERGTAALRAGLAADPVYVAYAAQHATEGRREAARDLADAVRTLKVQKTFLIGAMVQDPTAPHAATFLSLARQTDAVAAAADLAAAQTLVGTIDAAIARAGLRASYTAAAQAAARGADVAKPVADGDAPQGPMTPGAGP